MLKILWKMGEIAPQEQFLPLSTIFYYLILEFYVKTGIRFSLRDKRLFEITEVEITRVDCISSDGHFSEVYLDCLGTALKSLLDVLYCRATVLDKELNSQAIACIRWAKVPKLSFKGYADNNRVHRRSVTRSSKIPGNTSTTLKVETSAPLL